MPTREPACPLQRCMRQESPAAPCPVSQLCTSVPTRSQRRNMWGPNMRDRGSGADRHAAATLVPCDIPVKQYMFQYTATGLTATVSALTCWLHAFAGCRAESAQWSCVGAPGALRDRRRPSFLSIYVINSRRAVDSNYNSPGSWDCRYLFRTAQPRTSPPLISPPHNPAHPQERQTRRASFPKK